LNTTKFREFCLNESTEIADDDDVLLFLLGDYFKSRLLAKNNAEASVLREDLWDYFVANCGQDFHPKGTIRASNNHFPEVFLKN